MNRHRIKQNKHGFTLAELLVVIAIIMILAGVSFVALLTYIRNMQVLEMDNAAKEIFIVAQNHLSQAYASGELERGKEDSDDEDDDSGDDSEPDSDYYGYPLSSLPNYLEGINDDSEAEYYYWIYEGYPSGTEEKKGTLNSMVPQYSIEDDIGKYGNYIIVYEKNTATVLGVFYSGRSHTYFGSSKVHAFTHDEAKGNADSKEAAEKKEKRKHYLEDTVIGWYGANSKDIIPEETLEPLTLIVHNESRLWVEITNPNYEAGKTTQVLNLVVEGLTSNNGGATVHLTNYSKVEFTLDDITVPNSHFCNLFSGDHSIYGGNLIPGEDLRLYAVVSDTAVIAEPKKSNVEVENSLFESYSENDSGKNIAEISNIRHLENLDPDVSNLGVTVEKAGQLADLVFGKSGSENGSFAEEITGVIGNDGRTLSIYGSDGTTKLSDAQGYYGVKNSTLESYDGQGNRILNIYSAVGSGGNTGIFAETNVPNSLAPAKYFMLKNLTVKDSSFAASSHSGGLVGYNKGNLRIFNCEFTGDSSEVSSVAGDAGALVGYSENNLEITYSDVLGDSLGVTSTSGDAGGIAGVCDKTVKIKSVQINGDNIRINGAAKTSNAGGILGNLQYTAGDVTVESCSVTGKNIQITAGSTSGTSGNAAGGIIGNSAGEITINGCFTSGENFLISAQNAGGIIGYTGGALKDVRNTYCSSYVFATINAGGFIGYMNTGSSVNNIANCYVAGHTKNSKYQEGTVKTASPDNFNVISDGAAGGFIGRCSSASTSISDTYSTCSVYSSSGLSTVGFAGGFIGEGSGISVYKCYSVGIVSIVTGGNAGGFVGSGSVSAPDSVKKCYYLKGQGYNSSLRASASGDITNITSTSGTEISATGSAEDAEPWDNGPEGLGNEYPYKTIKELSDDPALPDTLGIHYGDWSTAIASEISLTISNAEKLAAIITIPTSNLSSAEDYFVSMVIEGLGSENTIAYMQLDLTSRSVNLIRDTDAIANIIAADAAAIDSVSNSDDVLFITTLNYKIEPKGDDTEYHIYLDDITTAGGNFASVFRCFTDGGAVDSGFIPGEDIRITAESGCLSWSTLINDAETYESSEGSGSEVKITGITNSLFAPGSGNNNYTKASYYSDIDPENAIVSPVSGSPAEFNSMALMLNFRHLQNLDQYVSGVGDRYTKARIYRDLYWRTVQAGTNNPPAGYRDFISATGPNEVKIYSYDDSDNAVAENNTFFGIMNENLRYFDGGIHSINNVLINNRHDGAIASVSKENPDAGLFRYLNPSSAIDIRNIYINSLEADSENGNAGGLIGNINPDSTMDIQNIFMNDIKVNSQKGEAGGLIGYLKKPSNSGEQNINTVLITAPVVTALNGNAGGLIGNVYNGSKLIIDYAYIYGKLALVRTTSSGDHSAGGFFGAAVQGAYEIKDCGASVYVYSEKGCAGGFIGDFKPKATTTITDCFAGGHVKNDGTNVYDDNLAVGGDSTEITNGGYNVCGYKASGGFIGFIGTDMNDTTTFEKCFTTASVYTIPGYDRGEDSKKGAVGGFVGRLQHNHQKYKDCYAAGEVFVGSALAGGFVGHYNRYASSTSTNPTSPPEYENDYVLTGLDYNDSTTLELVNTGTNTGYSVTGIYYVEHDAEEIVNENSDNVNIVCFNQTKDEYPYKDSAMNKNSMGSLSTVFYGDWVEPDSLSPVKIINGNRLIARITLRGDTYRYDVGSGYNETYVRLKGLKSGVVMTFRVLFRNGETHIYDVATGTNYDSKVSVVYNGITPDYLDFCIDNVSAYTGNYMHTMGASNAVKPGEDFTIYVSKTQSDLDGYYTYNATANSLFQKIEEIKDSTGTGTGNYIASISNSRHLMNLNSAVSALDSSIKVTQAVQTDNIYWADDGTFVTQVGYTAYTPPYETELEGLGIVLNGSAVWTSPGKMKSIISDSLGLYDGGNHAIYKAAIEPDAPYSPIGIFASNPCALTIQNLKLVSPSIIDTGNKSSAGILVGVVENPLTVNNLSVSGNLDVTCGTQSGALIGSSAAGVSLDLNHVTIDGNVTVSAPGADGGVAGGLIGETGGVTTINDVNVSGSITVNQAQIAGGLIAKSNNGITMTNMAVAGPINVTSSLRSGGLVGEITGSGDFSGISVTGNVSVSGSQIAGGLVGVSSTDITMTHTAACGDINVTAVGKVGGALGEVIGGTCTLNDVGILGGNGVVSNSYANAYNNGVGGLIGELSGTQMNIQNCYTSIYVDGNGMGVGGFIGNLSVCTGTIQNCYASGHTALGGFVDSEVLTVPGHINVIGELSSGVGGFIGYAVGGAGKVYITNCFSTNSVKNKTTYLFEGGFAGVLSDNVNVSDCYTISKKAPANAISFAGSVSGGASVSILDNYTEEEANRCDAVHNDATVGLSSKYPYKNWTDKSGSLTPGSESNIVFYGDWVD